MHQGGQHVKLVGHPRLLAQLARLVRVRSSRAPTADRPRMRDRLSGKDGSCAIMWSAGCVRSGAVRPEGIDEDECQWSGILSAGGGHAWL